MVTGHGVDVGAVKDVRGSDMTRLGWGTEALHRGEHSYAIVCLGGVDVSGSVAQPLTGPCFKLGNGMKAKGG